MILSRLSQREEEVTLERLIEYSKFKKELSEFDKKILYTLIEVSLSDHTELRNLKIVSITKKKINFSFHGHEVGGSYVYDYEVSPAYIKFIEYHTNHKTEWIGSKEGSMGYDIYYFSINKEKIVNKSKYKFIGQEFHLDSLRPSAYSGGITWAYLYTLVTELEKNNKNLQKVGIELKGSYLYIDNKKIANIVDRSEESHHLFGSENATKHRTHFKATFDLLIGEFVFRMMFFNKYREMVNLLLKEEGYKDECILVSNYRNEESWAEHISVKFSKLETYDFGSRIFFINKEILSNLKTKKERNKRRRKKHLEEIEWERWRNETQNMNFIEKKRLKIK